MPLPGNKKILILGGTIEARQLAGHLARFGKMAITTLAGVTRYPRLPQGRWRSGGFGGADGLADYAACEGVAIIVDATHPFAAKMSANAAGAATRLNLPLVRLTRPPWAEPENANWLRAANLTEAVAKIPGGKRVFLTTGRQDLKPFLDRQDLSVVVRTVDPVPVPDHWVALCQRPPFSYSNERALMREHKIDVLVTKNAGGKAVAAKLQAAGDLGIEVVMIERPPDPEGITLRVESVEDALRALENV